MLFPVPRSASIFSSFAARSSHGCHFSPHDRSVTVSGRARDLPPVPRRQVCPSRPRWCDDSRSRRESPDGCRSMWSRARPLLTSCSAITIWRLIWSRNSSDGAALIGETVAEANHIQLNGRHQLKLRGRGNSALQISSQLAVWLDDRSHGFCPVDFQRGPGFQRAEAAREVGAKIAGPRRAGGHAPFISREVGMRKRQRPAGGARHRAPV